MRPMQARHGEYQAAFSSEVEAAEAQARAEAQFKVCEALSPYQCHNNTMGGMAEVWEASLLVGLQVGGG